MDGKSRCGETVSGNRRIVGMKRFLALATGVFLLIGFISSAQAAIKIEIAEVQNGAAYIQGNVHKKALRSPGMGML